MNAPRHAPISCDEALRLLSRSLDGDLTRAETRQLYLHLASCESCHAQMGEMAMLAAQLAELNQHYTSQSLDAAFLEKVQEAVRHVEQEQPTRAPAPQPVPQGSRFHVHEV
jgi:predicted anti-sigma-YlaC factor YlaD